MDKPRDVRRGASRFSAAKRHIKQSGHKPFGGPDVICGDSEFSEKSKKEKVRSLSAVSRALSSYEDCEMGCNISEKVDAITAQPPSSIANRRFKIPKKFFGDCNGVDHASVPRKLRSAMKKRNGESIVIDSEKVNHKTNGIESPEKDGIKKAKKQGSSEWSLGQTVTGPITKDEEEVVETLYALAGMFPDSGSNDRSELHGESLPENSSTLQDFGESPNSAFEASGTGQDVSVSCAERSPEKASKIGSLNETIDQKQPDLPESSKFSMASDSTALITSLQNMPLAGSEKRSDISSHDPGLCLAIGLDRPQQSPAPYVERRPEIATEMKNAFECKQEQHMIKDQTKNGLALWPGLSPVASDGKHAPYLQSSAAKAPVWLDGAVSAVCKQGIIEGCSSGGKVSQVVDKRSWKRCAAHVHISRLIQRLQIPNSKDMFLEQPNQMRAREGQKHGVLAEVYELNGIKNEATSTPLTCRSATVNNSHEAKSDILQQQHLYNGIRQAAPSIGVYGPQKQNFDFLSLSSGGSGLKFNNNYNKVGNRLEPLSKLQVPYHQSLAQQHGLMPFPMPQNQYASTYRDQISVPGPQVRLQLPPYYGNPAASNKQLHQNFWAVQLAAQGRSAVNCSIQYPNWQTGRQDSAAFAQRAQHIIPPPPASLGPKITPISQSQQNLIARTSGLDFHIRSICEENKDRLGSNGTTSLQLLCDERIGL